MKKFVRFLSVLLFITILNGCYRPAPVPPPQPPRAVDQFTIEVKVDKPVYQAGDKVLIAVRANRECYLSLYNVSTLGEVTQIFPNRYAKDSRIRSNQIYQIPDQTDKFVFEVQGPPGIERIRAVGTRENVNFFEETDQYEYKGEDEVFPRIQKKPEQFDRTIEQRLDGMASEQWAEANVTFEVR